MTSQTGEAGLGVQTPGGTQVLESEAAPGCPKCGSMEPWGAASWCPTCGYYPAFAKVTGDVPDGSNPVPVPVQTGYDEQPADSVWEAVPPWMWVLGGGVLVILGGSIAASVHFHLKGGHRAFWAATELTIGIPMFVVAHLIAARAAMKHDRRVSVLDIVSSPVSIWQPSVDKLPKTSARVCSAVWGVASVISGVAIIGGINYTSFIENFAPEHEGSMGSVIGTVASAAKAQGKDIDSMEEAFAELGAIDEMLPDQMANPVDDSSIECVVFGYLPNKPGTLGRVLFGSNIHGALRHVATLDEHDIPEEDRKKIMARTREHTRLRPAIPCKFWATWVEPKVKVRLEYDEIQDDGSMTGVRFKRMADGAANAAAVAEQATQGAAIDSGVNDIDFSEIMQQVEGLDGALGQ